MRRFRPSLRAAALPLVAVAGLLAACSQEPEEAKPDETELPKELAGELAKTAKPAVASDIGTPLEQRVATIGVLNKRNNLSQDLKLKPGEAKRLGNVPFEEQQRVMALANDWMALPSVAARVIEAKAKTAIEAPCEGGIH